MFWKQLQKVPSHALNSYLWSGVALFGIMGVARGLDEGNIAGSVTQPSFMAQFGLADKTKTKSELAELKSTITSMVQLGSIGGSIIGLVAVDWVGRVNSLRILCVLWMIGVAIQISSLHGPVQYELGRLIAGLGIGIGSVVSPTYLSEIAPTEIRGLCTCCYSGSVYFGIMIGYFSNWGTSVHIARDNRNQWVIPTCLQLIFAGLSFMASFFVLESPRWLLKVGREGEAIDNLEKIRGVSRDEKSLSEEITKIEERLNLEKNSQLSPWKKLERLFVDYCYQINLGLAIQLIAQWTGANAVTIYAPDFFSLVGIKTQNKKLFASSMFGVVKFIAAICCALFIIDSLGRKKALYIGITLQTISIFYIGLFLIFEQAKYTIPGAISTIAVIMIYVNGIGWAVGWNSIQYLINAEIFPIQFRSIASSLIMLFHHANQYANSKALPHLLLVMDNWGAMMFFAAISFIGLVFAWFFIPEPADKDLEDVEDLFTLSWYKIGRQKK